MQSVRFVLRTVCPRLIRAKKQSVRFVIRTVCPRLINPYNLSTPNQGTPYNLSPYGLSEANQQSVRFVIRTVCLQTIQDIEVYNIMISNGKKLAGTQVIALNRATPHQLEHTRTRYINQMNSNSITFSKMERFKGPPYDVLGYCS